MQKRIQFNDDNEIQEIVDLQLVDGYYLDEIYYAIDGNYLIFKQGEPAIINTEDVKLNQSLEQEISQLENQTAEYIVDLDFRLSNIELGL